MGLVVAMTPSDYSALPRKCPWALPKWFSGEPAISKFVLAFHPYPQLIPNFSTLVGSGPPVRVTAPSSCALKWIDPVSDSRRY